MRIELNSWHCSKDQSEWISSNILLEIFIVNHETNIQK